MNPYIADICQYNFEVSAYKDRLNLYQSSFDDFINKNASKKYDLIISNPPFLDDIKSKEEKEALQDMRAVCSFQGFN